jgi:catechol 2,3-dioxygenase-like lactoylglutathione lyase family enzyme
MKYTCSLIAVKDITASRKFYEDLFGLKVSFDFGANIGFDCGLALQQNFAELIGVPTGEVMYKTNNFELYFEEENLDEFMMRLKEYPNLVYMHKVKEYPWGQRVIRFYDLDSHIIEVGESMEFVIRRFLKQGLSAEETAKRTMYPVEFVKSL